MAGEGKKIVAVNKDAKRSYEILEKLEAGVELRGNEVKSIRQGRINLKEAYVRVSKGEAFLLNCNISPYEQARVETCEPLREKRLLLHKKEIYKLEESIRQKGLSVVPMNAYFKTGKCKIELGVGRGKKLHDKRQDIKKREANREMNRALNRALKRGS